MQDLPEGRRRVRRAALSGSAESEGTPRDLNADVEDMATQPVTVSTEDDAMEEFTPQNRMNEVEMGSKVYAREYRLKLVHRMLMRNVPLDKIATELDVSVHTIMRDRTELNKRLREEARNLDINHLIGDTVGFYKEVQGMSLRTASHAKAPINMKLAAMRTALASMNDQHKFLSLAGVYDALRYEAAQKDGKGDIEKMVAMTEAILMSDDDATLEDLQSIADVDIVQEDDELHLIS